MNESRNALLIERIYPNAVGNGADGRIETKLDFSPPGLLDMQKESFDAFLAFVETDADGRSELKSLIEDELGRMKAEFEELLGKDLGSIRIGAIELDRTNAGQAMEEECIRSGKTYELPIKIKEDEKLSGADGVPFSIPMMTSSGSFIVNGVEKVMLSQLVRSPGISFEWERGVTGDLEMTDERPRLAAIRIITEDGRGPWLKFSVRKDNLLEFSVWKKRPAPASSFFKACGVQLEGIVLKGTPLEEDADWEKEWVEETIERKTTERDLDKDRAEAFYRYLNHGKTASQDEMSNYLSGFFFDSESYLIGETGRDSFARKLGARADGADEDRLSLNMSDLEKLVDCVAHPENYLGTPVFDVPEQLSEKRVRRCGDFLRKALVDALQSQFWRMRIQEERSEGEGVSLMAALYAGNGRVTRDIRGRFNGNSLLQVVDQCNPLAGLTQKRRLSCFGPNGLSSKNVPEGSRLVERSHYGRICPIETPEGQNVGVVTSLALYAKVDGETGTIRTPFRHMNKGKSEGIVWLSPSEEDVLRMNPSDACSEYAAISEYAIAGGAESVSCRAPRINANCTTKRDDYGLPVDRPLSEIAFMDATKSQIFSVSGALIPFVNHDDAHRALMGANMQRQAIPLLYPEAPYVGTGIEGRAATESGAIPLAKGDGTVVYSDAKRIAYECDGKRTELSLPSLAKTNKGGTINLRPLVKGGDAVHVGQVLADGYATDRGELALGANLLAAYMCWEGYNYEDGIVLSQRVLDEDLLTSVHVFEYEIELRDTKFKAKGADGTIETLSEHVQAGVEGRFGEAGRNLTKEGVVRVGAHVSYGDVLVAKATYESKKEKSPADIFLDAAKKGSSLTADFVSNLARRECSLRVKPFTVPEGVTGTVVDVIRKTSNLDYGVNEVIVVRIAQTRKVEVGDKLAGRHGNKGVISKILPTHEMPFLADGTPIDIILNPLGVPSRLNVGQLYECALGWAAKRGGDSAAHFACPAFDGPSKEDVDDCISAVNERMREQHADMSFAPMMRDGKVDLFDGRTGEKFASPVAVGYAYMMKLDHMVQDKMHARATGPYSQVECQPLKGRSNKGGQRLGDMEGWAIEAYGASELLHELFTAKSDSVHARSEMERLVVGRPKEDGNEENSRLPESTEAFLMYLRALCLKPSYSKDESEFKLSYARKEDMASDGRESGELGPWPEASKVTEFKLFDYTRKNPVPTRGGLLDTEIFGASDGTNKIEERRSRMGYIDLSVDKEQGKLIYHPWFVGQKGLDLIKGEPATIERLPVLPVELRPVTELNGGFYTCADLNILYRNIIMRNDVVIELRALKKELESDYGIRGSADFEGIFIDERDTIGQGSLIGQGMEALQLAVDQLIDNGHCETEAKDSDGRSYDSLTDKISGKSGIIRKSLLGKRIDYSGRSVIAPDPTLAFDECGLPYDMAKKLFRLQLIAAWLRESECHGDERQAEQRVDGVSEADKSENWKKLEGIMADSYVLLNRAPTLHRMGIQAYRPILTDEKAIRLHPLACSGFNADFDGDTMAVYAPTGEEACAEAASRMRASLNILSPANGKPLAVPSQDMVIGLYYKTATEEGRNELFSQIWNGSLWAGDDGDEQSEEIRSKLSQAVQKLEDAGGSAPQLNTRLNKKECSKYVGGICRAFADKNLPVSDASPIINRIMWLGFKYATISGLTISYADTVIDYPAEHDESGSTLSERIKASIDQGFEAEEKLLDDFDSGMLSREDYIRQKTGIWGAEAVGGRIDELVSDAEARINEMQNNGIGGQLASWPILSIADSGARGTNSQIRQVIAMRGLMGGSYGEPISAPIVHSLAEGVSPNEYWLATYSSRRKVMDTALGTATSGELARTLVNAVQDVIVTEDDCGAKYGRRFAIAEENTSKLWGAVGRYLAAEVVAGDVKYPAGTRVVSIGFLESLIENGVRSIELRSPLTCAAEHGVCAKCYGWDLSKRIDAEVGDAVGIIAAQSLSEPATQLTLSSFHGGGAAGNDITEGLPRIKELLNASDRQNKARLSRYNGVIYEIVPNKDDDREVVRIMPEGKKNKGDLKDVLMPKGLSRFEGITAGKPVSKGDALSKGAVTAQAMLNAGADKLRVAEFVISELQKQLKANGIDVDDRHLELIVAEMLRDVDTRTADDEEENRIKNIKGIGYLAKHPHEFAADPETGSFLAAAGVEGTRAVLHNAIVAAEGGIAIDYLTGFKENLILGRKVPVGTGYSSLVSEN